MHYCDPEQEAAAPSLSGDHEHTQTPRGHYDTELSSWSVKWIGFNTRIPAVWPFVQSISTFCFFTPHPSLAVADKTKTVVIIPQSRWCLIQRNQFRYSPDYRCDMRCVLHSALYCCRHRCEALCCSPVVMSPAFLWLSGSCSTNKENFPKDTELNETQVLWTSFLALACGTQEDRCHSVCLAWLYDPNGPVQFVFTYTLNSCQETVGLFRDKAKHILYGL